MPRRPRPTVRITGGIAREIDLLAVAIEGRQPGLHISRDGLVRALLHYAVRNAEILREIGAPASAVIRDPEKRAG
jgi:hypothetical protein